MMQRREARGEKTANIIESRGGVKICTVPDAIVSFMVMNKPHANLKSLSGSGVR